MYISKLKENILRPSQMFGGAKESQTIYMKVVFKEFEAIAVFTKTQLSNE